MFFKTRSLKSEILDHPEAPKKDIQRSLDFMVGVNRYLGGSQTVLNYFEKYCVKKSLNILDLGTGSGDIPYALVQWAKKKGKSISITALDIQPVCMEYSQKHFACPEITYLNHSAFDLASLGSFDYITSSMFFHHLTDQQIVTLLQLMKQNCKEGFIVNDLYRSVWAYAGVGILGMLSGNGVVLHDATLSVARSFRNEDGEYYKEKTGIRDLKVKRKPIYRMTLSWHRQDGRS